MVDYLDVLVGLPTVGVRGAIAGTAGVRGAIPGTVGVRGAIPGSFAYLWYPFSPMGLPCPALM